jgi:UDP-N-acetylmuramyl pentapeptide phosphotransferase/UDP-N-acetylglucosamine-1-phosphate transferase
MHALALPIGFLVACALAPATLRLLRDAGHVRVNYRGRSLPCPGGALVLAAAPVSLVAVLLLQWLTPLSLLHAEALPAAMYAFGVLALGLLDDYVGTGRTAPDGAPVRGLRGHLAAVRRGELSTGAVKAAGCTSLALAATAALGLGGAHQLLAAAVLVLATHVFNLLDLRPGRASKALVLLGAAIAVATLQLRPLWSLGVFAGPALVAGLHDIREQALLGDTGAGLLGALAGLWLVLGLGPAGQLAALAMLIAIALYAEIRSLTELIERTPGLRELDSWGRPT